VQYFLHKSIAQFLVCFVHFWSVLLTFAMWTFLFKFSVSPILWWLTGLFVRSKQGKDGDVRDSDAHRCHREPTGTETGYSQSEQVPITTGSHLLVYCSFSISSLPYCGFFLIDHIQSQASETAFDTLVLQSFNSLRKMLRFFVNREPEYRKNSSST